jgi:hypothetical protein
MQQNALQMVPTMVPTPDGVAQREGKRGDRAILIAPESECVREVSEGVVEMNLIYEMKVISNQANIERGVIDGCRNQKEADTETDLSLYRHRMSRDPGERL